MTSSPDLVAVGLLTDCNGFTASGVGFLSEIFFWKRNFLILSPVEDSLVQILFNRESTLA